MRQQHNGKYSARSVSVTSASAVKPAHRHLVISIHVQEEKLDFYEKTCQSRFCYHLTRKVRAALPELSGPDSPEPAPCIQHGCHDRTPPSGIHLKVASVSFSESLISHPGSFAHCCIVLLSD